MKTNKLTWITEVSSRKMMTEKQFILKALSKRKIEEQNEIPLQKLHEKLHKEIQFKEISSEFIPNLSWKSLCEQTLISNFISHKYNQEFQNPKFSCLNKYLMMIISSYLGYKLTMVKLRYLSKDWIHFTQEIAFYLPEFHRKAQLKVII